MKRRKRNTSGSSHLLEHSVNILAAYGFEIISSEEWRRLGQRPLFEKYVVRNWRVENPFGPGYREGFIVCPSCPEFILDDDGTSKIIFEAKWQEGGGSADEKLAYVWTSFVESDVPNWIVVMDGAHWRSNRGKRIVTWMQSREIPQGKTWRVFSPAASFIEFANRVWR